MYTSIWLVSYKRIVLDPWLSAKTFSRNIIAASFLNVVDSDISVFSGHFKTGWNESLRPHNQSSFHRREVSYKIKLSVPLTYLSSSFFLFYFSTWEVFTCFLLKQDVFCLKKSKRYMSIYMCFSEIQQNCPKLSHSLGKLSSLFSIE